MADLHQLGPHGEAYAWELLKRRGHVLLQRNFRCPRGELDLITWHRDTLVFVEVRAREADEARSPAETIGAEKRLRVQRAAQWYLGKRVKAGPPPPIRFDVVSIEARGGEIVSGEVFESAFPGSA